MNDTLSTNIRQHLAERNMTVSELERRTGLKHAIINILHGRSKNPTIRVAQAIAKELNCRVEDLFASNPSNPLSNEPWNGDLYAEVVAGILARTVHKQISYHLARQWIEEIYQYVLKSPTKQLDEYFLDWFVDQKIKAPNAN